MPELEQLTRNTEASNGPDGADRTERGGPSEAATGLDVASANVAISGDPTDAESAALTAVLAEHLRAEAEAEEEEGPRYAVDPWCLAGRLGRRTLEGVPTACPSGREWKASDRNATW